MPQHLSLNKNWSKKMKVIYSVLFVSEVQGKDTVCSKIANKTLHLLVFEEEPQTSSGGRAN